MSWHKLLQNSKQKIAILFVNIYGATVQNFKWKEWFVLIFQPYNPIICKFCALWKTFFKYVNFGRFWLSFCLSGYQKLKREIKNIFSHSHNVNFWNSSIFALFRIILHNCPNNYWRHHNWGYHIEIFISVTLFATWESTTVPNFRFKAQAYQNFEKGAQCNVPTPPSPAARVKTIFHHTLTNLDFTCIITNRVHDRHFFYTACDGI